jgi:hypothetical protein
MECLILALKHIARAAHGPDLLARRAELGAQHLHMGVHRPLVPLEIEAPHVFQQLVPREHDALVFEEKAQQAVLLVVERQLVFPEERLVQRLIHAQPAGAENRALLAQRPAQQRVDPRHKHLVAEGLGDVVVRPVREALHLVPLVAQRREHHDRHFGAGADLLQHLPAVVNGHHHIQNDQIRRLAAEKAVDGLPAVGSFQIS